MTILFGRSEIFLRGKSEVKNHLKYSKRKNQSIKILNKKKDEQKLQDSQKLRKRN